MNKKPIKTGPKTRLTRSRAKIEGDITKTNGQEYIYKCQFCSMRFTRNSFLFRHMANHQKQLLSATFQCNICLNIFSSKVLFERHLQLCQTRINWKCSSCSMTFKSRHCLRRHQLLKKLLLENMCLKCPKTYINKEALARHVQNKHMESSLVHQCEVCELKFKWESSLASHLRRIHKML